MSTDPLTGLPVDFVRMLAVKIDPYANNPNKPLDLFFAALMRAQSFRAPTRKAVANNLDSNHRPEEGRFHHD
jgi:hypothetical protein